MSIRKKITLDVSLCMTLLHQENKLLIGVIRMTFLGYRMSILYRHCKKDIINKETDKRKNNKGRRKSLTVRDERRLIRKFYELKEKEGSF